MIATYRNLLHSQKPWQWISATGGSMLLGSACVSKGEEQHKTGARLERQLPLVDAVLSIAKRLVLEDG